MMKILIIIVCFCSMFCGCFLCPNRQNFNSGVIDKIAVMGIGNGKVGLDDSTFTKICQKSIHEPFGTLLQLLDSIGYKTININENIIDMGLTGAMIQISFDDGQYLLTLTVTTTYIRDSYHAKFLRLEEYQKYIVYDIAVDHANKFNKNLRSKYWP